MSDIRCPSICPPTKAWPRAELEAMVEKWLAANVESEQAGDWTGRLADMYCEDAVYCWNIGPNEEFQAHGRKEIRDLAVGYWMQGFEKWQYPYHDIIIDEKRGTVIGFWKQVSPFKRADGSQIVIEGIGGSWFQYGGNNQWAWQRDFFDFGNAKDIFFELAGMGVLEPVVKQRIHQQAKGILLPGHVRLRPNPTLGQKIRNGIAIVKIALLGK